MPKFVASVLTLLIALVYGVGAAACPSGAMVYQHGCKAVVKSACTETHVETFLTHAHEGQSPCEAPGQCQVQQSSEQSVPGTFEMPRLMPVLVALLDLRQAGVETPQNASQAAQADDLPGDLVLIRTTYLLI